MKQPIFKFKECKKITSWATITVSRGTTKTTTGGVHTGSRHMCPQRFLLLIILLGFFFSTVTAFSENTEFIIQNSYLSESYKEAIMTELKNAIDDGIPENLLEPRIREGIAKGAEGERILQVLRNEIQLLKKARVILLSVHGGKKLLKDEASWARTANLLSIGISEEEIKTIVEACQKRWRDYRSATYLYASLIRWKLSREKSLKLIEAVLKSSLKGEDFTGIIETLIEGRRLHIPPEKMAERIIATLPDINSAEELSEKILYINQ